MACRVSSSANASSTQWPVNLTPRTPSFFSFPDPATTEIYTLSLHDALPISSQAHARPVPHDRASAEAPDPQAPPDRSEEHTSELQSHHDLVCRLLLEKKK